MECTQMLNKIKLLFQKIRQPGYTMDNHYSDNLINKFISCPESDVMFPIIPLMPDMLADSLLNIRSYHTSVQVFLIRTLGVTCRTELYFTKILSKRGDKLYEIFNELDSNTMNPSLRVAYMEVALSLVTHISGINWIWECNLWQKFINVNTFSTVFVSRLMYQFSSDFLWKLNDMGHEAHIVTVVEFLCKPVQEFDLLNIVSYTMDNEIGEKIYSLLEPTINIILCVMNRKERYHKPNLILNVILNDCFSLTKIYVMYEKIRKDDLTLLLSKLIFCLTLLRVFQTKPAGPDVIYVEDDFREIKIVHCNIMQHLLQKKKVTVVIDFCYMCNVIWSKVCGDLRLQDESNGRKVEAHNQMLILCLVPLVVHVHYNNGKTIADESIEDFICLLLNKSCEHIIRMAYMLRDTIMEMDTLMLIRQCIKRLTCFKGHLNNEQANVVFRALFFVLRSYDPTINEQHITSAEEDFEEGEQKVIVMTYVMDTVLSLVKNYNINWHESLEVICLNTLIHNILMKRSNLTCKFIVASLNLMTVTVQKFLPPNLSLLIESTPGSAMDEIGQLIYLKMNDRNWEVRDCALELLYVCTEISYIKFPPFQKQIIENNLTNVALTIAFNDYESYVQVSALKCIAASVRVTTIWEHLMNVNTNLLENLAMLLHNNQEGIVRKEVCNVLCEVYQNVKLSPAYKHTLYNHMALSAISDFHWEVQIATLKFWKIVIQSFLTDQGMLDGTFPPVTFSRVSRKIVTLNDVEIQKRLVTVLEELSAVGCLTVLLKLLHDDNEVEVMDAALALSQELFEILQKYKVPEIVKPQEGDPRNVNQLMCDVQEDKVVSCDKGQEMEIDMANRSDNVIESILNEGDINLLAEMYKKHLHLQNQSTASVTAPKIKLLRTASPHLFVSFMKQNNCEKVIKQKKEWRDGIRSVSSLLDDVLGIYETCDEVNSLDCY